MVELKERRGGGVERKEEKKERKNVKVIMKVKAEAISGRKNSKLQ